MSRHSLKQLAVKIDRLARASEFLKHNTGIVDRVRVILAQRDRLTVSRQRFFQSGLLLQRCGAIVERLGVVRLQLDGMIERRHCLVEQTPVLQDRSQIIVDHGNPGIERNNPSIRSFGGIQFVLLMQHGAEIELGLRIGRPQRDRLAIR